MREADLQGANLLHRHIGGLEIIAGAELLKTKLHRHIGGLENRGNRTDMGRPLHRHIGGLESLA